MDWDWHLIIEIATLVVAATGTTLVWAERIERRRQRGVATQPRPLCRVVDGPSGSALSVEVSNPGGAAPACCVVVQFDDRLFTGNFALADQQTWAAQTLEQFDIIPPEIRRTVRDGVHRIRRTRILVDNRTGSVYRRVGRSSGPVSRVAAPPPRHRPAVSLRDVTRRADRDALNALRRSNSLISATVPEVTPDSPRCR